MTPRSPNNHHKTTTAPRRLRYRTDQNLSVQPLEIPQSRHTRPRRAATLPTPHFGHLEIQALNSEPTPRSWEFASVSASAQPGNVWRLPESGLVQPTTLLQTQTLDFGAYELSQSAPSASASTTDARASQIQRFRQRSEPELSVSGAHALESLISAVPVQSDTTFIGLQDMSTLDYMMAPSQYGMHHYGSTSPFSPNYPAVSQQGYSEHRSSTAGTYDTSYAVSPALSHDRRHDEHIVLPPYSSQPALARSPYQQQQQPLSSMRAGSAPAVSGAQSYVYPTAHNSIPSQPLGSNATTYPPPALYPPTTYGVNDYHPLPTMYPPTSTAAATYPAYEAPIVSQPSPTNPSSLSSSPNAQGNAVMPRILNSRPKPQCWEHGCNGRQFSTFSNLLRHQREKSGTASKSYCPRCGAEFTRTTARNGHMAHDKCKPRRPSETDQ